MSHTGRLWCVVFLMAVPLAAAEITSSVEQLLKSITDGIEAKSSDSDLAHQVDKTKLNGPLSENEIRWLAKAGAESKTLKALRKLQARSACMAAHCQPVVQFEPQPTKEEIDGMLRQARNYVHRYIASLIDFTCTVTIKTYSKESKGSRPLSDTLIGSQRPRCGGRDFVVGPRYRREFRDFSVIDTLLLRPLPVFHAQQLRALFIQFPERIQPFLSYPIFKALETTAGRSHRWPPGQITASK